MVLGLILSANTLSKSAIDILYCNRQVRRDFLVTLYNILLLLSTVASNKGNNSVIECQS